MAIPRKHNPIDDPSRSLRILAVSDIEHPRIYDQKIKDRFGSIDLVLACGDLPNFYLDYIISMLDVPMFYVNGNHVPQHINDPNQNQEDPQGAFNLHKQVIYVKQFDLILAGIEGCQKYNKGRHQYTQGEMWLMILAMVPKLIWNKMHYGRYLDIFVAHAPAWKLNDETDLAHRGIKAFRWLIETFHPRIFLHGHVHTYRNHPTQLLQHGQTSIYNAYGYQVIEVGRRS
jgi:hypothetical protein